MQTLAVRRHSGIAAFAIQLPEDLTSLTEDDLASLLEQATGEFDEIHDSAGDAPTAEQLNDMENLAAQINAVRSESQRRSEEASARAERLAGLRDTVHPAAEQPGLPAADSGEEAEAEGAEAETEEGAEALAAGGRPSLSAARRQAPATPRGPRRGNPRFHLVASAGLAGFEAGADISFEDAARIFDSRKSGFKGASGRHNFPIASIRVPYPENLTAAGGDHTEVLRHACDESRLEGGSLTAAGTGWAAPSEILYDVADDGSTLAGLVSLPEVGVTRGGIRFTRGADFASVYDDGFYQTEADNIAGTAKSFVEVPAPAFLEERLDAIGVGVKSGILQQVGFPESIAQFMRQTMVGHQHRVSQNTINKMVALSQPVTGVGTGVAVSLTVLNVLEFQAMDIRYKHVLDPGESIELVLPYWLIPLIKADYAKRNAIPNPLDVTDEQVQQWFTNRGFAPQFTYDWQSSLTGGGPGNDTAYATDYPANVQVLMYRAGTFARGLEDVITINGLYDSALLADNKELGLFTEQGLLVAQLGFDPRVVTIPVKADGNSGAQAAFASNL